MIKEINENDFQKDVLESKEKILVDFYANWCGPCRMLRPILEDIAKDGNTKIVSINVDDAESLAREYEVISIPCLVLFRDGKEINRSVGLKSKDEIENFIK
ncbi:MAG: thioredoxin [Bacilli bacterium]|nr:thioredoxin [Bacilli bacterium]